MFGSATRRKAASLAAVTRQPLPVQSSFAGVDCYHNIECDMSSLSVEPTYGISTSVASCYGSRDRAGAARRWRIFGEAGARTCRNSAPSGCVHGTSNVQPTEEQKKTFKKIVESITKQADDKATTLEPAPSPSHP